jgi:hypothetical protein
MSKHTPGPWFADGERFVRQAIEPRHVICRLPTVRNPGDQQLIASAPLLLAFALTVIKDIDAGRIVNAPGKTDRDHIAQLMAFARKVTEGQA